MILEKAWAKLHGSYVLTRQGYPSMVFTHLTGSPTHKIDHSSYTPDEDHIWKTLKYLNSKKCALVGCAYETEGECKEVVSSYTKIILSLHEVVSEGQPERLLKIRDPLGFDSWEGAWSDRSDKWTPELRKKLNLEYNLEDGVFYMCLKDYLDNYNFTNVIFDTKPGSNLFLYPRAEVDVEFDVEFDDQTIQPKDELAEHFKVFAMRIP